MYLLPFSLAGGPIPFCSDSEVGDNTVPPFRTEEIVSPLPLGAQKRRMYLEVMICHLTF